MNVALSAPRVSTVERAYVAGARASRAWLEGEGKAGRVVDPERVPLETLLSLPLAHAWSQEVNSRTRKASTPAGRQRPVSLVVDITVTTRRALREVLRRGIDKNFSSARIAREMADVVGLTERHARAVLTRRDALEARGFSPSRIQRDVTRYADRLIRQRAKTIALTEVKQAREEEKLAGWEDAVLTGDLPATVRRQWIAGDPCPLCAALSELSPRGLREPFSVDGRAFMTPPAHPRCKCRVIIVKGSSRAS